MVNAALTSVYHSCVEVDLWLSIEPSFVAVNPLNCRRIQIKFEFTMLAYD